MILNVTLIHDGETINPALIEELGANLISGLGKKTPLVTSLGVDYIVVNIPWVDGRLPGCYSLELKGIINSLAWASIGNSIIRYTSATEVGSDEVTVEGDAYDVTMEAGYYYTDSPIARVEVSVDDEIGTPSAEATYEHKVFGLAFHNLKGEPGETGNGISGVETETSSEDGGQNLVTIHFTDSEDVSFPILNGTKGSKGDTGNSAIFDPQGEVIISLENGLGGSTTNGMTQKAISDALGYEKEDLVSELEDGFYSSRTIGLSPTKNTSYGSTYKCYRTSEVGIGWTYKYKMQATNSGACWAKLKDGKITEFCPTASGQVGEGTVVCDGTFDEILFNTNNGLSDKVLERCYNAMDGITEQLEQIIPAVESHEATLTKEEDILDEFEDGYIATTVGSEVPAPNLISGWLHVRTTKVEVGYSYDFNLASGATGRCWAKVKDGVIIETSTEESSHTNSGTVVCDGTFDELIFNTAVSYGQKVLKRKRSFESLVNDAAIHGLGLQQRNHRQRIEYLEQCINTGMPWNGMALPSRPSEFKILAIGNSFTGNTFRYLVAMLESLGISGNVTYGYTFASGNSLANEVTQFDNESSAGSLNYIKQGGAAVIVQNCTIQQALDYDDWDVVMLQQASGSSANWKSYSDLAELVKRIRLYTKNRPKIVFNLTWATGNQTADLYGGMYGMYVELMNVAVMLRDKYGLDIVIPQYQSFQMVRNDSISEGMAGLLDSASYHANDYGQIVAGLTIIEALIGVPFNKSIRGVTYRNDYLTDDNAATLINLVRQAVAYPYKVLPDVNEEEE